jgi:ribosomal protein S18 acetylase RimI-like enzyme
MSNRHPDLTRYELRPAAPADAAAVAALHAASWKVAYRGLLADDYLDNGIAADRTKVWNERLHNPAPSQRVVLAHIGDSLIGFTCVFLNEDPVLGSLLDNIHVDPQIRRRGVGEHLLAASADLCRSEAPGSGLYLSVLEGNLEALRFYLAMGAQVAGAEIWDAPDGQARRCRVLAWPVNRLPD